MRARLGFLLLALISLPLVGQQGESISDAISVDIEVVNIPITVTDKEGRFVSDLEQKHFEIYEDGQPVEIRYFTPSTSQDLKPRIRVGFLIDLSNTARLYYKNYRDSIGDLAYLLVPEGGKNEGFLVGYHPEVDQLVDYTRDPYDIAEAMEKLKHGGGSAMLDAVYMACHDKLLSSPYQGVDEPRKILVVVGDGHDNASNHTLDEVIFEAQRQQVTIYSISTVAWGFHEKEEKALYRLAKETGGMVGTPMQDVHTDVAGYLSKPQDAGNYQYEVGTGLYARAQLAALYKAILGVSGNVMGQYILGFTPLTPFSDPTYRKLNGKVVVPAGIDIHARAGYYPPPHAQ